MPPAGSRFPRTSRIALTSEAEAKAFFDSLSFTHQKEWARWVTDAKKPETRERRIEQTVAALRDHHRSR